MNQCCVLIPVESNSRCCQIAASDVTREEAGIRLLLRLWAGHLKNTNSSAPQGAEISQVYPLIQPNLCIRTPTDDPLDYIINHLLYKMSKNVKKKCSSQFPTAQSEVFKLSETNRYSIYNDTKQKS